MRKDGRRLIYAPGHPRADKRQYVLEYILIAENALGKHLPSGAVIHHLDGDATNCANSNLVICQDQAYHVLLHCATSSVEGLR